MSAKFPRDPVIDDQARAVLIAHEAMIKHLLECPTQIQNLSALFPKKSAPLKYLMTLFHVETKGDAIRLLSQFLKDHPSCRATTALSICHGVTVFQELTRVEQQINESTSEFEPDTSSDDDNSTDGLKPTPPKASTNETKPRPIVFEYSEDDDNSTDGLKPTSPKALTNEKKDSPALTYERHTVVTDDSPSILDQMDEFVQKQIKEYKRQKP